MINQLRIAFQSHKSHHCLHFPPLYLERKHAEKNTKYGLIWETLIHFQIPQAVIKPKSLPFNDNQSHFSGSVQFTASSLQLFV